MVKVGSSWFGHFDDAFQYEDFAKPWSARCIAVTENFERETGLKAYEAWMRSRTGIPTECGRQVRAPLLSHCFGPRSQGRRPCGELRGWGPQLAISARPARLADRHSRIAFQSDVRSPNLCRHFNAGRTGHFGRRPNAAGAYCRITRSGNPVPGPQSSRRRPAWQPSASAI